MGDEEMVAYLAHALQEVGGARPSIETLLHGFLATEAVIHTHADAVVSLQQRPGAGGDRVRLRTERGLPRIPAARLPDLERGRRVRARAPRGESPHPGEARDDYLGPDDPRSLRGDGRADQPGGGGHRRAEAGAPCLR